MSFKKIFFFGFSASELQHMGSLDMICGVSFSCVHTRAQSCLTLCDPRDCSPPGSSVHGIVQARVLEWVAISSSRGPSPPRDRTWVSCIGRAGSVPLVPAGEAPLVPLPGIKARCLALGAQGLSYWTTREGSSISFFLKNFFYLFELEADYFTIL